jgi:hypothetical protein
VANVIGIAEDHVALNLALTGVNVRQPANAEGAEELLRELLDSDNDVVIVQESYRDGFSERFTNTLAKHKGSPLIVYCPMFEEEDADVDAYLSAVLKPAIGYEIRLE